MDDDWFTIIGTAGIIIVIIGLSWWASRFQMQTVATSIDGDKTFTIICINDVSYISSYSHITPHMKAEGGINTCLEDLEEPNIDDTSEQKPKKIDEIKSGTVKLDIYCIDRVQYVYDRVSDSLSFAPLFDPDGMIKTCTGEITATPQAQPTPKKKTRRRQRS